MLFRFALLGSLITYSMHRSCFFLSKKMAHGGAALFCACGRARFRERVFGPYRLPPVKPLKSCGQVFGFSLVGFASFSFSFSLVLGELWFCFVLVLFLFALVLVLFILVQSEFVFSAYIAQ